MSPKNFGAALLLMAMLTRAVLAQDVAENEASFDAAAEIAAFSKLPEQAEFKRLWTSQKRVRLLKGLAISRDATRVLALLSDGTPVVYDGNTGAEVSRLAKPDSWAVCSALSPDGSQGAIGLKSGVVIVFDTVSGRVLHRYENSKSEVDAIHFAGSGKYLAWVDREANLGQAKLGAADEPLIVQTTLLPGFRGQYTFNSGGERLLGIHGGHQGVVISKPFETPEVPPFEQPTTWKEPIVALGNRYLAYYDHEGRLAFDAFKNAEEPDRKPRSTSSFSALTADLARPQSIAISSDDKWIIGVGRGQIEIRTIECPIYSSIHSADFDATGQVAISADTLRVAIVDDDGYLAVLALPAPPEEPAWRFTRLLKQLVHEKRFADLDRLAEVIRDDADAFPFEPAAPKYQVLVENMLRNWNPLEQEPDGRKVLKEWREAQPESTLARIAEAALLIDEGWEARGSGFASSVSAEAFEKFHLRLLEASNLLEPLLEEERPAPQAVFYMLTVAKAESHSLSDRMEMVQKVMEVSPRYSTPHVAMLESLLPRWGGEPGSAAHYAGQVADEIGGDEGDVLYAKLAITLVMYEGALATEPFTGFDFDRALRGAEVMQQSPHLRPLGMLYELRLADVNKDTDRVARVVATIHQEKLRFTPGAMPVRYYYEHLYRSHLGRGEPK
jgi:hypothetical protein